MTVSHGPGDRAVPHSLLGDGRATSWPVTRDSPPPTTEARGPPDLGTPPFLDAAAAQRPSPFRDSAVTTHSVVTRWPDQSYRSSF